MPSSWAITTSDHAAFLKTVRQDLATQGPLWVKLWKTVAQSFAGQSRPPSQIVFVHARSCPILSPLHCGAVHPFHGKVVGRTHVRS